MGKNGKKWEDLAFFIGSSQVKVDNSGRFRIPSEFLNKLKQRYGDRIFLTSIDGLSARLYPMEVWYRILEKFQSKPSFHKVIQKILNYVNYYGKEASIDGKGRILIHPLLREKVNLKEDIILIGSGNYITLWNRATFEEEILSSPLTDAELEKISELGI